MNIASRWYQGTLSKSSSLGIALFILRIVAGLALVQHGWMKIQTPFSWMGPDAPVPGFFQLLAAFSEFGGGIAWVIGLLTPLASFGIACTMAVAVATHLSQGAPWVGHGASFELALLYFAVAVFILFNGPGKLSIDRKLFGRASV
jgi:putative oxidoreductase